jgi:hypothetical protein
MKSCATAASTDRLEGPGSVEDLTASNRAARSRARIRARCRRARGARGDQLGTLGSGNHFVELQVVDEIFDAAAARARALRGQITVLIHGLARARPSGLLRLRAGDGPRPRATASRFLTGSSRACRCRRPRPELLRRHERGRELRLVQPPGDRREGAAGVPARAGRRPAASPASSTTSGTTPPRSSATATATCASTAGRHARVPDLRASWRRRSGSGGGAHPRQHGDLVVRAGGDRQAERLAFGSTCTRAGAHEPHGREAPVTGAALRHELEASGIIVRCARTPSSPRRPSPTRTSTGSSTSSTRPPRPPGRACARWAWSG